jgi:hypothetical protein
VIPMILGHNISGSECYFSLKYVMNIASLGEGIQPLQGKPTKKGLETC